MQRTVPDTIQELLLSLPGTEEKSSHGTPGFKVAGKLFAYFTLDHHGDGRAALWLAVPRDVQQLFTDLDPRAYFVPPYVGPRGWLGVELNKGLAWAEIIARVRDAYEHNAPAALAAELPESIDIEPPNVELTPEDINPMLGEYAQGVLAGLAERCRRLPESTPSSEMGCANWKAGKKTFVRGHHKDGRLKLLFRVSIEQQAFLTEDPRYTIPMYYGSAGWIELDVQEHLNWLEVESLLEASYRHFALKRMLKALDDNRDTAATENQPGTARE